MGIPLPPPSGIGSWFVGGAIKAMLSAIGSAVDGAAAEALRLTGSLLGATTSPGLLTTWFSATYWRVAALSALLTVPFLFAAAVHALVRSDIALLGRAAFGYLPLAGLGVTIAAPLTTLLLSATDEMCAIVAGAAGHDDASALVRAAAGVAGLAGATGSPMLGFFIGLLAVAATLGLWIELLIRAAAVDVIVLLLPLFFAAMVWPARRVWAVRAIETLIALILSKFAIVAVLTLGGSAFTGESSGLSSSLVGATLIILAVLSPWALLRLLPLHEVAAAAAGGLSQAPRGALRAAGGTVYAAARAASAGPDDPDAVPGLGAEDDAADAIARTGGFDADTALAGATLARAAPSASTGGRAGGSAGGGGSDGGGAPDGGDALDGGGALEGGGALDGGGAPDGGDAPDGGGSGGGAGRSEGSTDSGVGARSGTREFDAETAAGLAAVEGTGRPAPLLPGAAAVAWPPADDRPPIDPMFGQVEWEGFVIGEEGDDVMEPPRFTTPGQAPRDGDDGEPS